MIECYTGNLQVTLHYAMNGRDAGYSCRRGLGGASERSSHGIVFVQQRVTKALELCPFGRGHGEGDSRSTGASLKRHGVSSQAPDAIL
jgi:hypothetical protein